ncbi:hypothetical protein HanRHA438_Chr13g0609321 [Helianthus annuus]|nr:hypothetical protein HanRHA438_Chr13g0609321 [Helianthus annuus]
MGCSEYSNVNVEDRVKRLQRLLVNDLDRVFSRKGLHERFQLLTHVPAHNLLVTLRILFRMLPIS